MYKRSITFGGINSLTDLGIRVVSERTETGSAEQRYTYETIPFRNGVYNSSAVGGFIPCEPITLTYVFLLTGKNRIAVTELSKRIINAWLGMIGDLYDSDLPDWKYTNAMRIDESQIEFLSRNFTSAYFTVRFTADPYMQSAGGTRSRAYKFTAQGDTAFRVLDNAYIFQPEWSAMPTVSGNDVQISIPESGGMGTQYFTLSGIPEGAEVTSASVQKNGESGGTVSMIGNDSGSLYLAEKGATISIAYSEEVSPTDCTGGHRAAVYSAEAPYTYRLKAYTEGTPTVKLNGTLINISQPFTMPDRALITIQNTGYGYYELWHDTTEVRL